MTPDDRRPNPDHDDELADAIDIEESAQPRHAQPPEHAAMPEPVVDPPALDEPVEPSRATGRHARADDDEDDAEPADVPEDDTNPGKRARFGKRRKDPGKARRKAPWWELPALVMLAILIAILVKTYVVQPFYIPSESMEKTLHGCTGCSGDRILVNKPIFDIRDPHPGDIVVFDAPPGWDEGPRPAAPSNPVTRVIRGFGQLIGFVPPDDLVLVKRVIAVGGQTVKGVTTDDGRTEQIMISDHGSAGPWHTLDEGYVYLDGSDSAANFGPVTVPKGRLWVMGDHRNRSADSRYHCGAQGPTTDGLRSCDPVESTVPIKDVIGKAFVIVWPPSRWSTLGTPATFEHAAATGGLSLALVFPVFWARRRRRAR